MLSRVANTLYWMIRYVERADNMARLIDVNEQLLLDFEKLDSKRLGGFWMPIVLATGEEELFGELYDNAGSAEVIRFLADDRRNPNSIVSCVAQARENARMVRDQLSDELWEELNALYLFINSDEAARLLREDPPKFHATVRRSVLTFHGIASSTISRTENWDFMDLGEYLERANKTTRFLDISNFMPNGVDGAPGSPGVLHWNAILRSCGAMRAFRVEDGGEPGPLAVARLLLFSSTFPRSVRFCIRGWMNVCTGFPAPCREPMRMTPNAPADGSRPSWISDRRRKSSGAACMSGSTTCRPASMSLARRFSGPTC